MKKSLVFSLVLGLLAIGFAACGEDGNSGDDSKEDNNNNGDDESNGNVALEIPLAGDQIVSELTDEDAYLACEAMMESAESLMGEVQKPLCEVGVAMGLVLSAGMVGELTGDTSGAATLTDAQMQGICSEAMNECMADDMQDQATGDTEDPCAGAGDDLPEDCDATVDEVEACYNAQINDMKTMLTQAAMMIPECDSLDATSMVSLTAGMAVFMTMGSSAAGELPAACDVVEEKCPGMMQEISLTDSMDLGLGLEDTDMGWESDVSDTDVDSDSEQLGGLF